jgi:PST family polysaccharide transporter
MNENLKHHVLSGVVWSGAARVGQQAMQFGLSIILARLLLPEDFGTIAMVLVFMGFANLFVDAGFGAALIQRVDVEERHIHSVFWLNVLLGAGMTVLFFVAAPFVAAFYEDADLLPLTRTLSVIFVISTVGMVPLALMQRRLQFHLLARISLLATLLSGLIGVSMAWAGAGVWSLVGQTIVSALLLTIMYWWASAWRPRLLVERVALRELWGFTAHLFGFSFINYWARNADNLVIGRNFGAAALGNYGRAYALMLLPITQVISVVSTVMFPALSSIQSDRPRVKRIYLRAVGLISLLTFPMMVGLLVTAEPFVLTVYGDNWTDVIPMIRILALVGIVQSLSNPTGWLYLSQGRTDWMFWWGVGGAGTLIAAIVVGARLGSAFTVAICYTIANLLLLYPAIAIPGRLIDLSFSTVIRTVSGPLVGASIMGVVVWLVSLLLPETWRPWQQLISLVACGLVTYGAFVTTSRIQPWQDILHLIRERQASKTR